MLMRRCLLIVLSFIVTTAQASSSSFFAQQPEQTKSKTSATFVNNHRLGNSISALKQEEAEYLFGSSSGLNVGPQQKNEMNVRQCNDDEIGDHTARFAVAYPEESEALGYAEHAHIQRIKQSSPSSIESKFIPCNVKQIKKKQDVAFISSIDV